MNGMATDATDQNTTPEPRAVDLGERRRVGTIARWVVAGLLSLVLAGALGLLGIFLFRADLGEEFTVGLNPDQYYSDFDSANLVLTARQYTSVYAVAHNSGGNVDAVLAGIVYGADIIEMDVVEFGGVLYSAHNRPLPFLGYRWFKGPSVDRVMAAAGQARGIMLDLKETDAAYVTLVVDFINSRPDTRPIFVSSRNPNVLRQIDLRAPAATLLLSVPNLASLNNLLSNYPLTTLVDGVSIRESVLDDETARQLRTNDLMIFAWVVNDLRRANTLIELGVDGITSDNLAMLNLLGGEVSEVDEVFDAGADLGTPEATPPSATPPAP